MGIANPSSSWYCRVFFFVLHYLLDLVTHDYFFPLAPHLLYAYGQLVDTRLIHSWAALLWVLQDYNST